MIRRASTSDASTLAGLESAAFESTPWSERSILALLGSPDTVARVAAPNRRVVGWIAFRRVLDEAELLRVAVDPGARRRGVARALLEHGLAVVRKRGARVCHLEVAAENAAARALYEAFGFREVGRRRNYYGPGRDALLLSSAPEI